MPDLTFRRRGNLIVAIGWPVAALTMLFAGFVPNVRPDVPVTFRFAIAGFAAIIVLFGVSMIAGTALPCLRLTEAELVIENPFRRIRIPWALVAGAEPDGVYAFTTWLERRMARPGLAVRDRAGNVYQVAALQYGPFPMSAKSPLLARARAAVNERAAAAPAASAAFEPVVRAERPVGRIVLMVLGPAAFLAVWIAGFATVALGVGR